LGAFTHVVLGSIANDVASFLMSGVNLLAFVINKIQASPKA
jgi:hypothetical protein